MNTQASLKIMRPDVRAVQRLLLNTLALPGSACTSAGSPSPSIDASQTLLPRSFLMMGCFSSNGLPHFVTAFSSVGLAAASFACRSATCAVRSSIFFCRVAFAASQAACASVNCLVRAAF